MIPQETIDRARGLSIADVAVLCGAQFGRAAGNLRRAGHEWNGPCPACGGDDRFWLDEGKNAFLCRMSGAAGGTVELYRHRHGVGFVEAVAALTGDTARKVGPARQPADDGKSAKYREEARRRAHGVWRHARSVMPEMGGHLVAAYFARRRIPFPTWPLTHLREVDSLPYAHWSRERGEWVRIHEGPAMIAAITGADGRFMGIHRTWLDAHESSGKAAIADPETGELLPAKKVEGSQRGGRILLRNGNETQALGEGIETVLSWPHSDTDLARRHAGDGQLALVCGINLDNIAGRALASVPHPSLTITDSLGRVRRVKVAGPQPDSDDGDHLMLPSHHDAPIILLGDADSDRFTTEAAMLRGQRRYTGRGDVCLIDWADDGCDFNDMIRAGSPAEGCKPKQASALAGRPAGAPAATSRDQRRCGA